MGRALELPRAIATFGGTVEIHHTFAGGGSADFNPGGCVGHHTVSNPPANAPSLRVVAETGRPDLALIVAGATQIRSDAGYGGVGPNFLPWVVGLALLVCGAFLVWEALSGGFRLMEEPSGDEHGHWPGFLWVSAGILATALLITRIGFVLACGLCFMLAVRGFKSAQGQGGGSPVSWLVDLLIGMAIAAPVFWMFKPTVRSRPRSPLLGIAASRLSPATWIGLSQNPTHDFSRTSFR